jgi:hypothetical protein
MWRAQTVADGQARDLLQGSFCIARIEILTQAGAAAMPLHACARPLDQLENDDA